MNPQPKPQKQPKQQCKCGRITRVVPCAFCKPKKRIRPRSKKRAKQERDYAKLRVQFLQDNPVCQIQVEGCTNRSEQVHHKRGRLGDLLTDVRYFCATCDNCHKWAENNPLEAKKIGASLNRLSNLKQHHEKNNI